MSHEALRRGMSGLEVTFNGTPVAEPHLCTFKITNTGRVPIVETDFSRAINVNFSPCSHSAHSQTQPNVLAYDLVDQYPKNLAPTINLSMGKLSISPILLNAGNSFSVRVLLDHDFDHEKLDINTRIVGIDEVKPPAEPRLRPFQSRILALVTSIFYVLVLTSFYAPSSLNIALSVVVVVIAGTIALFYVEGGSKKRS